MNLMAYQKERKKERKKERTIPALKKKRKKNKKSGAEEEEVYKKETMKEIWKKDEAMKKPNKTKIRLKRSGRKRKKDHFGFFVKWHINLHGLFNAKRYCGTI